MTLGKFAPLHRGHQLVIETALAEVDRVIVLIYDAPEQTTVPLPVRADWIRQIYPQVEVQLAWDGPMEVGHSPEIIRRHDDYLRRRFRNHHITHFFSSEFYGEHVSSALGCVDRRVDSPRVQVPISATAIRANTYEHREYLPPVVYRDLITRVVFVGAPSTGKSTLAEALAKQLDTVCMPEFGREFWERHQVDRRLTREQLAQLAEEHIEREERLLLEANGVLFVDTDATTTFMFSQYYHGGAHPKLAELADRARTRYDLCFLCEDDIPYDDTDDRSGELHRAVFQRQIRADLLGRRIPFVSLRGDLKTRVKRVKQIVQDFDRFTPLPDHLLRPGISRGYSDANPP